MPRKEFVMFHFGEFELYSSNNGNPVLAPLSSEEVAWDADDLDETLGEATLWLEGEIDRELVAGKGPRLPECGGAPRHGGRVITLSVERSVSGIPAVSAADAAEMLGVSRARIGQLCKDGKLVSWKEGPHRMISLRSLQRRMELQGKLPEECYRP